MRLGNTTLNKKKLTQIISTPVSRIQKANCDLSLSRFADGYDDDSVSDCYKYWKCKCWCSVLWALTHNCYGSPLSGGSIQGTILDPILWNVYITDSGVKYGCFLLIQFSAPSPFSKPSSYPHPTLVSLLWQWPSH